MGHIKIQVSDETEEKFRELAMRRYGFVKGSISEAAESAISDWIRQHDVEEIQGLIYEEKIHDPVKAIKGMLKGVKKSSVELKHEGARLRGVKYLPDRR